MPSPGPTEIATTTLRNRGAKMPSKSTKQAKTMSAIAHGWKPKGKAADIPVPVAKEFHAADAGKKYGAEKSSKKSSKSAPVMPPVTGAPPKRGSGESKPGYDRSGHFKGNPGFETEGKSMAKSKGGFGNIPAPDAKNSSLVGECGEGHASQPVGNGTGVKTSDHGTPHRSVGAGHSFRGVRMGNSYGSSKPYSGGSTFKRR